MTAATPNTTSQTRTNPIRDPRLAVAGKWTVLGLLLFACGCLTVGYLLLGEAQTAGDLPNAITPSFEFRAVLQKLVPVVHDAENGVRSVILSGDEAAYATYRQQRLGLVTQAARIERLFESHLSHAHDATHRARLADLIRQKLAMMDSVVAARKTGGVVPAMALVNTGRGFALTVEITKAIQYPIAEEVLVAQTLVVDQARGVARVANFGLLILATLLLAVVTSALLTLRLVARIVAAESAREEAHARVKDYAALSSDWSWESDADCVVRKVDVGLDSPIPIDSEQFIGIRMGIDRTPGIAEDDWSMVSTAVKARRPFRQFTFKVRDRQGKNRTLTCAAKPILDAAGRFAGYIGTARDITAEIEVRSALNDAQRKLLYAIDVTPGGITLVAPDGTLIASNADTRAERERSGYPTQPGTSYAAHLDHAVSKVGIWYADGTKVESGAEAYRRLLECGPPFEVRIGERWHLVRANKIYDGTLIVASSDVTELKLRQAELTKANLLAQRAIRQVQESESRFRDFAGTSSDWLWELDKDLVTTSVIAGDGASPLIDASSYVGTKITAFKPPGMADADFQRRSEALGKREPYRDVRFEVVDSQGKTHTVSSAATPRFDPDGAFLGYRGTTRDITVEVEMRTAFDATQRRLLEAIDAAQGTFVLLDAEGRYIASNTSVAKARENFGLLTTSAGRYADSLQEWVDLPLGKSVLPWLQGAELERLRRMLQFFLLNNQLRKATKNHPRLRTGVRRALGVPLRWRMRTKQYSFPWELWVGRQFEKIVTRRSLVTGQALQKEGAGAC